MDGLKTDVFIVSIVENIYVKQDFSQFDGFSDETPIMLRRNATIPIP